MAARPTHEWPDDDELVRLVSAHPTNEAAADALGVNSRTLASHLGKQGLRDRVRQGRVRGLEAVAEPEDADAVFDQDVRQHIGRKKRIAVEDLADALDVAPRKVRDSLERLRIAGYRIPEPTDGHVELQKVVPDKLNLHKSLLTGTELQIGLVSDTHLSSNEQALAELELAYDVFAERGITEVLHAGDWTCGAGIFKTQAAEIFNHTFESQVDYLAEHYPRRPGIVTRGISGNHDIEGDFGRIGANPVVALANRRDDIEFLGDYSAWVELPNGAWLHLLHGKGGMSYAYSYKAQKLVDSYPSGRKPAVLACGHWHVSGNIEARGVHVVWPACFEWKGKFLERLGLNPSVGFHILHMTLGEDGSLVRFMPEFFRFWEGRVMVAA